MIQAAFFNEEILKKHLLAMRDQRKVSYRIKICYNKGVHMIECNIRQAFPAKEAAIEIFYR